MKKFTSIFFICSLLLTITPTAFAQFSGGDGTENNPYIITTPAQLAQLATYVNEGNATYNDKHYKLGNDLDLSEYQTGNGWNPIGRYEYESSSNNRPFNGFFDGNKRVITNLKINRGGTYHNFVGLFGYVFGTVKNIGVSVNIDITGNEGRATAGGVVGYNNGYVLNCYSIGLISTGTYAGGIVGYNNGNVSNCYSTSAVNSWAHSASGANSYAGGVVAYNIGSTSNCYSIGTVKSDSSPSNAGGVVGNNDGGSVSNCAALNPSLTCTGSTKYFGRITGRNSSGTLANNIGFNNMTNPNGSTTWSNTGASNIDGENITIQTIDADGTLGGRFTNANGWTAQNGKLPGLFGNVVDMPEHLRLPRPYITTTTLPNGLVGISYNQTLTATGETPITWSLESGSLPTGLTLTSGGVMVGVPSNAGIYRFTVKATNSVGFDTQDFVVYVINQGHPLILTETLPNGEIGELYQQTLAVMSDLPVTWSLEAGNLPAGLALSADGIIIGVPTTNGLFTFTVKATNAIGADTRQLRIDIGNVGISEHDAATVKVYPNPTYDKFVVELNGTASVKLYDMLGKEVLTQTAQGNTEINISHLPTGIYNIIVFSDGKIVGNSKIVKQ